MAITFSKAISTINFLNAYNNNVVEFSSDNVLDAAKCIITVGSLTFEITPIDNVFYFDFKEVASVLINSNSFIDATTPTITALDATTCVYNNTDNTYLSQLVSYELTFSDESTESTSETYKFLKSVEQLEENQKGAITSGADVYALSPFETASDTYNVTYFEGYPFDISFLLNTAGITTILNQTNAATYDFTLAYTVSRLFFSDGRSAVSIEDFLALEDGLNELKITRDLDIIYINIVKIPAIDGQYLKWLNSYGGWSYWLFNCVYKRDNKTKDLGVVNNDYLSVSETTDPFKSIGKTSQDSLTLHTTGTDEEEQQLLNELFDSPKVYYFTGLKDTQATASSWLACKLSPGGQTITNYKRYLKNYKLKIELPQRYTMKL